MSPSHFHSYGFVGLGLIGGSVARMIRRRDPAARIVVFDVDDKAVQLSLTEGIADVQAKEIGAAFTGLDLIFLCGPVQCNNENLKALKPYLKEETTVTDIGSVKTPIHNTVIALGLERQFVGGHPMAGSERTGFANSSATLLENAYYVLTHTDGVEINRITELHDFIADLGAIPLSLTASEHDYITGAVSHLPHVISASLVNLVQAKDDAEETMKQIAAGGFKDITRISSSSPVMWQQIALTNKDNLLPLLDDYLEALKKIREEIAAGDSEALFTFFDNARAYRESFAEVASGPIAQTFVLYVDIADESGQIAGALSLLSENNINIKNLGITHNREAKEGTLEIEFYDNTARLRARQLLTAASYRVSTRD